MSGDKKLEGINLTDLASALPANAPVKNVEKVTMVNNYGEMLVGVLHRTSSEKLVILCHGFQSSKEDKSLLTLADALTKEGFSAFRFDFAGNGESDGVFQYGNYRKEADDLRAVIIHLAKQKYNICAILGHSKGGNAVLLYASIYGGIDTVINISGRFALERGISGRLGKDFKQRIKKDGFIDVKDKRGKVEYRVMEESLMDRLTTDMRAACISINKECRVLTVHGSADEIVPVEDAKEFAKLIANHKLCIIEGANHNYTKHQSELASIVLDLLKRGCPPSSNCMITLRSRL
ncbi:arylesterase-like [Dioscorea cayenensis subsp. rotundata]|uniref:Arylesterase-like n=1 Tax=Dioscorea cayennensis subsp. rotundata TaxID=55577 RepID=A0AB40BLN9_DIOCR|nr:arylesterase-like [Dioscorea cayenensis subsp. rotundata]